eukprot:Rmarinus@m.19138
MATNQLQARLQPFLSSIRPWGSFVDKHKFSKPNDGNDVMPRIKRNIAVWKANYAVCLLITVVLTVLMHPGSLLVLSLLFALWAYVFLVRTEPIVVQNRALNETESAVILAAVSFAVVFLLTNVGSVLLFALSLGGVGVLAHAALRREEESFDEETGSLLA